MPVRDDRTLQELRWEGAEDLSALAGTTVRINLPLAVSTARAHTAGKDLPVRRAEGGGVEVLVPRVEIHEMLSLELS